ncbi:uncharacterized protein LOC118435170 [Folsomia candida]|uniref:Uncharacterized protein n=1 Tax=Folsomia candida TaxID=158441 RepID=A0A226EEK8_FOLCA|nr:uncharacterized protein LOC118435170 [Folsomia candida]OXA55497.1 hypothetical protein Fcan01_09162 [Folsomia candida]
MLTARETFEYELAVVVGGTKMIMLLQAITGPLFTWMLWILAFTVVTMGYVDHVCVGWDKVMPGVQLRRVFWNVLLSTGAAGLLYLSVKLLTPDVDVHNLGSVLYAVKYSLRLYNYWGPLIYFEFFCLSYISILSFFRFVMNAVLVFYGISRHIEWNPPMAPSRSPSTMPPPPPPPPSSPPPPPPPSGEAGTSKP